VVLGAPASGLVVVMAPVKATATVRVHVRMMDTPFREARRWGVDSRRLHLLLELSRLGSMRAVAERHHLTTSTVSQQLAALARDVGTPLLEPEGRRVRLTPAGHRLAEHAVRILAAVEAARLDLEPQAEPVGTVRVGGFATAVRTSLLPVVVELASSHPSVEVVISEYEPLEAFALLAEDKLDLALTYDYNLAPASMPATLARLRLWTTPWGLGVSSAEAGDGPVDLRTWGRRRWIVNSRNTADSEAVRTLGALSGFTPTISHSVDSLDLVEDLVAAGQGIGLLPAQRATRAAVRVLPLTDPPVVMTAYAVTRLGREGWSPLRIVLDRLVGRHAGVTPYDDGGSA
jgi:DNA-binding transcriptional LysR family regulator